MCPLGGGGCEFCRSILNRPQNLIDLCEKVSPSLIRSAQLQCFNVQFKRLVEKDNQFCDFARCCARGFGSMQSNDCLAETWL